MARHRHGWVKIHRKLLDTYEGDGVALATLVALVIMANHNDGKTRLVRQRVKVLRGQCATSCPQLSSYLGVARKTVERKLDMLQREGTIVQQISASGRLITLPKYEEYQGEEKDEVSAKSNKWPTSGQQVANRRPTSGHIVENGKKKKNVRSNIPLYPPEGEKVRKRKSETRVRAEALVSDVFRAHEQGLYGTDLEHALSADAKTVLARRYGNWGAFCTAYEQAKRNGDAVPFEYKLVKTSVALLAAVSDSKSHGAKMGSREEPKHESAP